MYFIFILYVGEYEAAFIQVIEVMLQVTVTVSVHGLILKVVIFQLGNGILLLLMCCRMVHVRTWIRVSTTLQGILFL